MALPTDSRARARVDRRRRSSWSLLFCSLCGCSLLLRGLSAEFLGLPAL